MTSYQITLLTKNEADKDSAKDLITEVGGEVTDEKPLGQKSLAYPIKKERAAYFTLLRFNMEPEQVLELNKELLLSGHLLRHMITTAQAKVPLAAAIIEKRERIAKREESRQEAVVKDSDVKPAEAQKPLAGQAAKKTKEQVKAEAVAVKERQKRIEAELEKILSEE